MTASRFERILQQSIFPDLIRGRKDYDLPHTKAVVHWIKEILKNEPQLDKKVLVTSAYAPDWGYIDMGIGASMADVMRAKPLHMQIGSERIEKLLKEKISHEFTTLQIDRVKHLVFIHDKLDQITADDEVALVEADTLGSLDTSLVTPTFSKTDNDTYIADVIKFRRPLFRHAVAIHWFDELLQRRINWYTTG